MASSALAGLCSGFFSVSHEIWAEAGPGVDGAIAAALFAATATLAVCVSPRQRASTSKPLPGLASRAELQAAAEAHFRTPDAPAAVILCELTGLAWLTRSDRADTAEACLAEAERRLSALLPPSAKAARWSEERFLVFLPRAADAMEVLALARDITAGLASGPAFSALANAITCHAGLALGPGDGARLCALVQCAELALAEARQQGTPGYGFYAPGMAAAAQRKLTLQRSIKEAVAGDALRLEFQPIYDMRSGALTGFEALIRLQDPELGPIPPSEFIPLAEQTGLIVEIGQWAVEEACRVAAQWPAHLVVAVNLSPSELLSGTLVNNVRRALQRHSLPAYRFEVEITEGTLMTDSELVLGQLRMLRDMGVGVALDDFGTGFSSLGYLCKFPFSKLKIDRSFVAALDQSTSARQVLRAIVKLGHGLGMTVTAEGIEAPRQLNLLRDIGCDLAQGYLLGRPAGVAELAAVILKNFAQGLARRQRPVRRSAAA